MHVRGYEADLNLECRIINPACSTFYAFMHLVGLSVY